MTRYRWANWEPPYAIGSRVQEAIAELEPLFPAWLRTLFLSYDDDDAETLAAIECDETAGTATITVYPKALRLDDRELLETLAHELGHAYAARLDETFEAILETIAEEDSNERTLAEKMYAIAAESLAESIGRLLALRAEPES